MRLANDRLKSKQGWVGFRLGWSPCCHARTPTPAMRGHPRRAPVLERAGWGGTTISGLIREGRAASTSRKGAALGTRRRMSLVRLF